MEPSSLGSQGQSDGVHAPAGPRDLLISGVMEESGIRYVATRTTNLAREAEWRHLLGRVPSQILAEVLTANVLLASLSKDPEERVSVQFNTNGPLGSIVTDADCRGWARGYTSEKRCATLDLSPSEAAYGLGTQGILTISRSRPGFLISQGSVSLEAMQPSADIARFLAVSDQVASALATVADYDGEMRLAAGMLVQALPGGEAESFERLKTRLDRDGRELLRREVALEAALDAVFEGFPRQDLYCLQPRYRCSCSLEKTRHVLRCLGVEELRRLKEEFGEAQVLCNFCGDSYHLDGDGLDQLIEEIDKEDAY